MESFLNHIKLECLLRENLRGGFFDEKLPLKLWINEGQGIPGQLYEMLRAIFTNPALDRAWKSRNPLETWTYRFDMYPYVEQVPRNFLGPKSYLRITAFPSEDMGSDGGSYEGARTATLNRESGLLEGASIEVRVQVPGPKPYHAFKNACASSLGHELLHAFEDYNRRMVGRDDLYTSLVKRGYTSPDGSLEHIKWFTYVLDPAEQRAWIVSFVSDVEKVLTYLQKTDRADMISGVRNIDKYLQMSRSWGVYEYLRDWVREEAWKEMDQDHQNEFVKRYNTLVKGTGRAPKTFNQLVKKIKFRWEEFDRNLKTRVSQAVARILDSGIPRDPVFPGKTLAESIIYQAY